MSSLKSKKTSTKKNILVILDFVEIGGSTRVNFNIIKCLKPKYNITLLTGVLNESFNKHLLDEIKPFCEEIITFQLRSNQSVLLHSLEIFSKVTLKLVGLKRNNKDYVIAILNLTYSALPFVIFNHFYKIRTFFIFHGAILLERNSLFDISRRSKWKAVARFKFHAVNYFFHQSQKFSIQSVDRVICFSLYSKKLLTDLFSCSEKKISVVNPYIQIPTHDRKAIRKFYSIKSSTKLILIASRIEPRKGIGIVVETAKYLLNERKIENLVFFAVGTTNDHEYFWENYEKVGGYGLSGRFFFLSPMKFEGVGKFIAASDLVLMPSVNYETLGLVTLESLAAGIPVISFNTGASPEILNMIDKNLVSRDITALSLSNSILWYLNLKDEDQQKLKQKAKNFVQTNFSGTDFFDKLLTQEF